MVDEVKMGETLEYVYSFSLTKSIKRTKCQTKNIELDTCQRTFVEDKLGCSLPWMRGAQKESDMKTTCNKNQLQNVATAVRELGENSCEVGCELYIPRIMKETHKYYPYPKKANVTIHGRWLSFVFFTDQQAIPVEETVLSYDSLDAIADIGGYLGLLLGASCLSILKSVFEKITRVCKSTNETHH